MADNHCSLSGEAAASLVKVWEGAWFIQLPHMPLTMLHENYWLAIVHKSK
jgi:hypothetical protein